MSLTDTSEEHALTLAQNLSPPEMLHLAITKKASIDIIERMSVLAERWQADLITREAKKAYLRSMVAAKLEMPVLSKNRHVQFNKSGGEPKAGGKYDVDYRHEDLAEVVGIAMPILAKHGLTMSWRTEQPAEGKIAVTCMIEHADGHREMTSLTAGVDTSGAKNHLQAIKSAATYLERFTALALTGLASRNQDDDGRFGGVPQETNPADLISAEQVAELKALLETAKRTEAQFCRWAEIPSGKLEDMPKHSFDAGKAKLKSIIDAAKAKAATND